MTTKIILLIIFAIGASFIQRVTGFGFGIFIMTVLPHLMPSYAEATALSGLLAVTSVSITAVQYIRKLPLRKLWIILTVFMLVSFFSVKMVSNIDSSIMRKVLGIVLIVISVYFFFFSGKIHMKPSTLTQAGMGTVSGFMGGFFAMQGPPAVIYFISCTDDKDEYIALTSWYFVIGNIAMTIFRACNGFVTIDVGKAYLIAFPGMFLGLWLGNRVYRKMPIESIRKAVYAYMAFSGILALVL